MADPVNGSSSNDPYVRTGNALGGTIKAGNGIGQSLEPLGDKAWVSTGKGIPAVDPNMGKELFRTSFADFQEGVEGTGAVMPKKPSLKLRVGAQAQSPISVDEGKAIADQYKKDGTLPTMPKAGAHALADAKIQLDTKYVSVGVEGLGAAAAQAVSNPELVGLYNSANKADLKNRVTGLQKEITNWKSEWDKPENQAHVNEIKAQAQVLADPNASQAQKLIAAQKLEAAAQKLEPLFTKLNNILDGAKGLIGETSDLLSGTKDGMRSASIDLAAGGVVQGKVTGRIPLGSPTPWLKDLTLMGQVKVIYIPKNPQYDPNNKDYPQFKYTLGEVKMMAQVTINGVKELVTGLNDAKVLAEAAQNASQYAKTPSTFLAKAMTKPDELAKEMEDLEKKTSAVDKDLKAINEKTDVKVDVVAKAVSPTSPIGVGASVGASANIADRARVAVVLDNVVGYLPGKEEIWKLEGQGSDMSFVKASEKERNVYHDFFPLKLKAMAQIDVSKKTQTEVSLGVEHIFGGTTAVYAGINQGIGKYVRVGAGGMYRTDNTGIVGGGLSFGPKDKWSLDLNGGVNPMNPTKEAAASVGFKVHF